MAKATYIPEEFGKEIVAPSGYYQPLEKKVAEYNGKKLLCILGTTCIDASCCGIGGWGYVRVEGYLLGKESFNSSSKEMPIEIDTIESDTEKTEISKFLADQYKNARIEFR